MCFPIILIIAQQGTTPHPPAGQFLSCPDDQSCVYGRGRKCYGGFPCVGTHVYNGVFRRGKDVGANRNNDGVTNSSEQRAGVGAHSVRLAYVPGLDGLRALAVIAVLLYHAEVPWMSGGFLGVEVFFVISGYLITSLLLR